VGGMNFEMHADLLCVSHALGFAFTSGPKAPAAQERRATNIFFRGRAEFVTTASATCQ
jgi:hypothetical protein